MTFRELLDGLRNGKTFENFCKEQDCNLVECVGNNVYYDDDLEELLESIGATIEGFESEYVVISTTEKIYKVPYEEIENRFDNDLGNEIILTFEPNKIVTN